MKEEKNWFKYKWSISLPFIFGPTTLYDDATIMKCEQMELINYENYIDEIRKKYILKDL